MGVSVFQFTHPGKEHARGIKISKEIFFKIWNYREQEGKSPTHRRKYIRSIGDYVEETQKSKVTNISLDYWGEWEPDSIAKQLVEDEQNKESAKYVHHPIFLRNRNTKQVSTRIEGQIICGEINKQLAEIRKNDRKIQNTDPFVYGDCFMYSSICKPKQTEKLLPGSIILFGSTNNTRYDNRKVKESWYRVDTVFVVKEVIEVNQEIINQYMAKSAPGEKYEIYYNVALKYLDLNDGLSHKLYVGATYDEPINGMYSFVPAKISSDVGYATMRMDGEEFEEVSQAIQSKGRVIVEEEKVKEFWERLLKYTYKKGYIPAVRINLPTIYDNIDMLIEHEVLCK